MAKYPEISLYIWTNAIITSKFKIRWFANEGQNMYIEQESYKQV